MLSVLALKVPWKKKTLFALKCGNRCSCPVHVHMRGSTISFVWIVFYHFRTGNLAVVLFSDRSFYKWHFQSQLNVYEYDNTYLYYILLPLQRRNWHWLCKQHHFMMPLNRMGVGNGGVIELNQTNDVVSNVWPSKKSTDLYHSTPTLSLCPIKTDLGKFPYSAKSSLSKNGEFSLYYRRNSTFSI